MRVNILYFALLREQRGSGCEELETSAATVRELYRELVARHGLTVAERSLAISLNETLVRWDAVLAEGDTVVFLPPVSGG